MSIEPFTVSSFVGREKVEGSSTSAIPPSSLLFIVSTPSNDQLPPEIESGILNGNAADSKGVKNGIISSLSSPTSAKAIKPREAIYTSPRDDTMMLPEIVGHKSAR